MNRGKKFIFLFAVLVFVVIGILRHDYYKQEKDLSVISSIQEEKIAFFYRDDCPDCQKVFPQVYLHDLFHRDIQFVNLNQERNRKYIVLYQIHSVPTFLYQNRMYAGTDQATINHFLEK